MLSNPPALLAAAPATLRVAFDYAAWRLSRPAGVNTSRLPPRNNGTSLRWPWQRAEVVSMSVSLHWLWAKHCFCFFCFFFPCPPGNRRHQPMHVSAHCEGGAAGGGEEEAGRDEENKEECRCVCVCVVCSVFFLPGSSAAPCICHRWGGVYGAAASSRLTGFSLSPVTPA